MVLREKDLTEEKYEELAKVVIKLCEKAETTLILHRFPEVVHHLGYDKLHLPLEMLKTIGRPEGLTLLYIHFQEIPDLFPEVLFCSLSQRYFLQIHSLHLNVLLLSHLLENVCKEVDIPVYAIGGITAEKMPQILGTGAEGGCMMSGFMQLKEK